ncbi:hypothetical protein [Roseinatronobacter alkalisoli]|uniref:Nitrogen fixation protein FixH n=1 Tax=Roseinatronobacter alkalisoli TaxID=3028235 RepID=A0ABT5T974_9RHOB|nr:hypothetical protein [Roseinatronobacter sp. HJB301]MDD7971270.1 hypothetical protein [Roseinatronobacter sp. HJB301]
MSTRVIALALLAFVLGFIFLMASVTWLVRDPLPIVGANQTLLLHSVEIQPQIRTAVAIDGGYRVDLTLTHDGAQDPHALLRPAGGQPIALDAGTDSAGAWSAAGQMTQPGRWELVLTEGTAREVIAFIVRE